MTDKTQALLEALATAPRRRARKADLERRTQLEPMAPAQAIHSMIETRGPEPTAQAIEAYNARLSGFPIVDVAAQMGLSINMAKALIAEAHAAISEDLKANLELNRQLDLARIDSIFAGHYPAAKAGDPEAANVCLRALTQRAKLTGAEPLPDPGRSNPQNVLVWIQSQLPSINRIVDSLPPE